MDHPLRQFRERRGLSQGDLAERASTTKATISRIETGECGLSVDMLKRLVAATGGEVTADDLIASAPLPSPPPTGEAA